MKDENKAQNYRKKKKEKWKEEQGDIEEECEEEGEEEDEELGGQPYRVSKKKNNLFFDLHSWYGQLNVSFWQFWHEPNIFKICSEMALCL